MRMICLIVVGMAQALAFQALGAGLAHAEEPEPSVIVQVAPRPLVVAPPPSAHAIDPAKPPTAEPTPPAEPDPIVELIKTRLADPALRKDANAEDLAAIEGFYAERSGGSLWVRETGFSTKGQAVLSEIAKADDWGLDPKAFALPPADTPPATTEAQADAEIKLDLAILDYARHARGSRLVPSEISDLLDQAPSLRDPKIVFAEIAVADAPGTYLQSLHPQHEGFARLQKALVKINEADDAAPDAKEVERKRLVLNMERWRWLPEDLGATHVWLNTPEYMLYMVKDGKTVFSDKTLVGTLSNPTPVFSADMGSVVFNPEWIAPRSVLKNALLPPLSRKNYDFLKKHRFSVHYGGKPVNVAKVKWTAANIHNYTFIQKPGPNNNLGKIKFLYPNKHDVYMHDTLPVRKKVFQKSMRSIGYGCVRMEKPLPFAEILLAEDQDFPKAKVKSLWDKSVNAPVAMKSTIPVHTVYFTAVAGDDDKVKNFVDLYGLDRKMASALFGSHDGFPPPPPEVKERRATSSATAVSATRSSGGVTGSLGSFLD